MSSLRCPGEFDSRATHELAQSFPQAPPTIERQMLLASFAAAALTGYLAQGPTDCNRHEIAFDCFEIADVMLAQFAKRVGR